MKPRAIESRGGRFARTNVPPALTSAKYNANDQQSAFSTTAETYDFMEDVATVTDANGASGAYIHSPLES